MDNKSVIKLLILNYFIRTCHVFKEKVTTLNEELFVDKDQ